MSQAPSAFTQAQSQGYGDFSSAYDDEEQQEASDNEQIPDAPQSPEPSDDENENHGFTQSQERSYPVGSDSPDGEYEQLGPESPPPEMDQEENEEDEEEKSSPSKIPNRRVVQIANDSDSDEPIESSKPAATTNRNFLQQFVVKKDEHKKTHRKRSSDDQNTERESKRSRKKSEEAEKTSDVDDVVDDIFGKDEQEEDDDQTVRQELEAELADLNNEQTEEHVEQEEEEEEEQVGTYDDDVELDEQEKHSSKKSKFTTSDRSGLLYEIDLIMERNRERRRINRRNKSKDTDLSKNLDDIAQSTIGKMRTAAEEDRTFNENRQPATAKLQLLPFVESQIYRADLTEIFKENGVISAIRDWLSPLPDKSLPNIKIRESLINMLSHFDEIDPEILKESGIGKAVMYLYKHPRETRENKLKLVKLIHDWSRLIFNLDTDYKNLSREDREKRDVDQATLIRQTSANGKSKNRKTEVDMSFLSDRRSKEDEANEDDCPRARVPRPSNRDYVVRPTSKVEMATREKESKPKSDSRLDEIKRVQQDRKRQNRPTPIVKLSIEGNRMNL